MIFSVCGDVDVCPERVGIEGGHMLYGGSGGGIDHNERRAATVIAIGSSNARREVEMDRDCVPLGRLGSCANGIAPMVGYISSTRS